MKKRLIWISIAAVTAIIDSAYVQSYFEVSKNLDIFSSVYREINVSYVEETNPGELIKTGIDAMLGSLDPYTNFIPEANIEDYRFMTTHEYGGIGALIGTRDGKVMITEPYENSPAAQAGLKAGDIIMHVAGEDATGKTSSQLSDMLRGASGTAIEIAVYRAATDENLTKTIERKKIKIDDVPYYGMVSEGVGYISLRGFTETASQDVKNAFEDLKNNHDMNKVILDLRGNGGGLLRESVNIVNFFVPKGKKVVETKGKLKEHYSLHRALSNPLDLDIPVTVLIDNGSASASEIVAGSLQDLDRAVVIGQNSFGKGLVQMTQDLSYNSKLKLTIAKYYTPSGRCIQRIDYGHRDNRGKANVVPDSLISEFQTAGGRVVKDGMGVDPDVLIEPEIYSDMLASMLRENFIFDFATTYYFNHDSISPPETFELSEDEFGQFVSYVLGQEFEYKTSSNEMMLDLKVVIEESEFWDDVDEEFQALDAKLQRGKEDDLKKFEEEIRLVLENEIVGRYYYSKGRIRAFMKSDPEVIKAIEILNNSEYYNSVLMGTCEDCLVKKG
ncbi:MAG: S41 family peptidase [Flavobacteriales bacterium]|nr:S41 family peptidase [Flavobacteriales bacterium]